MKKNVMLSLVAMTSASMGAYADADLTNNITTAVGELEAGDGLKIENGVLVSTGAPVELTIGTYVPGTYKLTATTNTNAKLTLKEIEPAEDGTFKLESETELTLVAESADGKSGFTVGGFGLSHVYDYKNAAVELRRMLSEVTAKLAVCYETDEDVVVLKGRASEIADKIKVLEGTDNDALYKAYKDYELYKGAVNSTISGEINVLKGDVQTQVDKTTATNNANGAIADLKNHLADVKGELDDATEYSKGKWTGEYTAIETKIADTETAINNAYKDGTATEDYSAVNVAALKKTIDDQITELSKNISASDADDVAYKSITPKLDAAKKAYTEAVNSLRTTLPGDPDVYDDLYKNALDELAVALNNLVDAGNNNGTAESHDNASEKMLENEKLIGDANTIITDTRAEYETLANTLKTAYSSADGDAKEFEGAISNLEEELKEAELLSKYQSDVAAVKGKVDAFRGKIEAANKDHSIDDLVGNNVEDYNNERHAVQQAIEKLTSETDVDLANYRAWKAMITEINELTDFFNEKKEYVNGLVSEDENYTVNGKYTGKEFTISKAISTYQNAANDAKAKNKAVAVQKEQANTKSDIERQISTYSADANDAVDHYNTFAKALAAVKEAKDALVEATKNEAVTTPDGTTYAAEIAAIENFISDQETAITTAMGKKDDTHYNAVMALSVTEAGSMTAKAEALTASYADNEKNYNDNNLEKSAELLSNEAQTQIANTQTKLEELKDDLAALTGYPTYSDLDSWLNDLIDEVDKIKADCPKYGESTDYTALMASLYQVIDRLDELNGDINDLDAAIDAANDIVKDNNANKTTADGLVDEIRKISGEARNSYPQSSFNDDDTVTPSETENGFLPRYRQLLTDIRTIEANISTAHGGYALVGEDWREIESTLDGYLIEANDLLKLAKAERANYDAYTEISDYYTEAGFTSLINIVITELKTVTDPSGAGYNYYRNLLDGADNKNSYKAQVAAVEAAIKASYEGYTAVADEDGQTKTIDNLVAAIKNLAVDAKDNEEAHNEQVERGQEVLDKWAEVYSEISATDESSKKQEYLGQLMGIQKDLLDLNEKVKSDWSKGESCGNGAMDDYDDIYKSIVEVANTQKDGYDDVVAADNRARYGAFLAEASFTQDIYVDAINTISKLMRTVNPEYTAKVQNIIDANKDIYDYSTKIRALKNTAEDTYEAVPGGELWDEDETNKATANTYGKEIKDKLNKLIGQIYYGAKGILGAELPAAQQKYDVAIAELKAQGYSKDVVDGAFADVKTLIDNISADATGDYEAQRDYVLAADGWLTELAKVDKMIADGQQAAASEEWNALITATNKQIEKERNALNGYITTGNLDASVLEDYDNLVENTVRTAEAKAEAATDLYAELPGIKELLDEFNRKNPYTDLNNDATSDAANKAAYEALTGLIGGLQTSLDDLDAYAKLYYVYYDCVSTINNLRTRINLVSTKADNSFEAGTAVADKNAITKDVNSITSAISTAKNMIDYTEGAALKAEIYELRNLNAEVYGEDADKFGEIEAEIDDLEKGVSYAYLLSKGKQEAYIAMEAKIAELQTGLETAKNANAVSEALAALGNALSAVEGTYAKTTLDGCHDAVKAEYTEALGEIGTEIDVIEATIAECGSENSLLFYNDKIQTSIDVLSGKLNDLASKINEMEAPYAANDVAYERLNGEIEALRNAFKAVTTTIAGYRDEVKNSGMVTTYVGNISLLLDVAQTSVGADHEAVKLTESSTVPCGSDIAANTGKLEKSAANYQAYFDIDDLNTAVEAVKATIDESTYSTETLDELTAAYGDIVDAISEADRYRLDAYRSNVDFVGEAVPAIKEKVAEITAAIEALRTKAETMSYVLGDVNRDGGVMVDDYTIIRNVALQKETIEAGSVEFFAADINGDGAINIGDVTGVSRIIMGNFDTKARSAARRMPMACDDAISLVSVGEGTQQRIAINLSAARTYVGCQMDIKLPAGITLTGESLGNSAAGLTLSSNDLDNGMHRIVVSSLSDDSFTNGNDAIIYLDVEVAYSYSGEGIEVTNIMFADENARVYNFADLVGGEATGISTVTMGEAVKSKVYSVGGKLMDGLKRGVNIIRNNDGSTKKVIVK